MYYSKRETNKNQCWIPLLTGKIQSGGLCTKPSMFIMFGGGGGLKNQILWGNRRRESEVPLETIWRLHCPEAETETQRVNRGAHMTHEWQSWDSNSHSALSFRKTEGWNDRRCLRMLGRKILSFRESPTQVGTQSHCQWRLEQAPGEFSVSPKAF